MYTSKTSKVIFCSVCGGDTEFNIWYIDGDAYCIFCADKKLKRDKQNNEKQYTEDTTEN